LSNDDGHTWSEPVVVDDQPEQQLIYPSVTPTEQGVLLVYCAAYATQDGSFNFPPDAAQVGGGKACVIALP
jgi:hypothetical protein